jgi:hypothetical protein
MKLAEYSVLDGLALADLVRRGSVTLAMGRPCWRAASMRFAGEMFERIRRWGGIRAGDRRALGHDPRPVHTHAAAAVDVSFSLIGMTLLAMLLLFAATGGVWTYLERIGAAAGLAPPEIGSALGASGIAGVLGPSVTLRLSRRQQRIAPIVIFMALLMAAQLLLMRPVGFAPHLAAACIFNFGWNALIPYYYSVLANIDREGRAAVAAGLTQGAGYASLLLLASLACLASLVLLWLPAARPVERAEKNSVTV